MTLPCKNIKFCIFRSFISYVKTLNTSCHWKWCAMSQQSRIWSKEYFSFFKRHVNPTFSHTFCVLFNITNKNPFFLSPLFCQLWIPCGINKEQPGLLLLFLSMWKCLTALRSLWCKTCHSQHFHYSWWWHVEQKKSKLNLKMLLVQYTNKITCTIKLLL